MSTHDRQLDRRYVGALGAAALEVGIVLLLAALVLDGGTLLRAALAALLVYLAMLGMILLRRPCNATEGDLLAIRCGFLLLCPIMIMLAFTLR